MTNILEVSQQKLVEGTKEELKKIEEIKPEEWAIFVKTGHAKQRVPSQDDWWYYRAASILKFTHSIGPIGVAKLRTKYGSKKNRGVRPGKFFKSSGNIIRTILQQLEKAGLVKSVEKGVHKGRMITPKGISLLSKVASSIEKPNAAKKEAAPKAKAKPKVEEKKAPAKEEAPKKEAAKAEEKKEE